MTSPSNSFADGEPIVLGNEQFRLVMQNSPIGMALVSLEGRWLRANAALCRLLGYEEEELLRTNFQSLTHPDDLEADLEQVRSLLEGRIETYQMEKRYFHKNKSIVWALLSVSMARQNNGAPFYFISQIVDITERKTAEIALRLDAERIQLAAQASKVGIWEMDLASRRTEWDYQMYELYGMQHETDSLISRRWRNVVHPDDFQRVRKELSDVLAAGDGQLDTEFRIFRSDDGSQHILRAMASVVRDSKGVPQRLVGTNWDVTLERTREDQLAVALAQQTELVKKAQAGERAKNEFLAVMSHEIRTPMNGVIGFADLLVRTPGLSDEAKDFAQTIVASGEVLLKILDDILDFSRLEAGSLHLEEEQFSPAALLADLKSLLAPVALGRNIAFSVEVHEELPPLLKGDARRLRQVLVNITGNSLKFTEKGEVSIRTTTYLGSPDERWVEFSVRDTGPGISEEHLERIFEPFAQVDSSASRRHGGTGLGLSISQRLIRLMGGSLEVNSKVGEGSEFIIRIPFRTSDHTNGDAPGVDQEADATLALRHPLRLMVVDDDRINLKLIVTMVKKLGYDPLLATNGVEAVEIFKMRKPDCILMDVQMPEMDGIVATQRIREHETLHGIPRAFISSLTANTILADRQRCFDAGMNEFVNKPLKNAVLVALLMQASEFVSAQG